MLLEAGKIVLHKNVEFCGAKEESSSNDWILNAIEGFKHRLADPEFPCLFARKAYKEMSTQLLFVRAEYFKEDLTNGVAQYVEFVKNTAIKDRLYSPLAIFFENGIKTSLKDEHKFSWQALQTLHECDEEQWPKCVPMSPDSTEFTFCFNGIQLFINISCPSHRKMKSRNLGEYITFIVNPRENFDTVASAQTESGVKVRERIRSRVDHFNNGFFPVTLGFFGDKDNLEWRQYQLEEPGGLFPTVCPLKIRSSSR